MIARLQRGFLRQWPHVLVLALLAALAGSGLQSWVRERLLDARFAMVQRAPTGQIVLVEIDPRSIDGMGAWPWARSVHADLVRKLRAAGAREIAFDVDFSAPSSPEHDAAFAAALQAVGGDVILASFRQRGSDGALHENQPIAPLAEAAWAGVVNVAPDPDGVIRKYRTAFPIGSAAQPSLAALFAGGTVSGANTFRIDYGIRRSELLRVSYLDVLRGDSRATGLVRGRKAIISGTAIELGDRFVMPGGAIVPGSVIQALATESLLQDRALVSTGWLVSLAGLAVMVLTLEATWKNMSPLARCGIALGLAALAEAAAILVQSWHPIAADTSLILAACPAYALAIGLDHFELETRLRSAAERRFQRVATSLSDGLACLDQNGRVTFWNAGAAAIFGYSEAEMRETPFSDLVDTQAHFANPAHLAQSLDEAAGQVIETVGRRKDGETFHLEASVSKWSALGAANFGVVLRDISMRKQSEERIRYLATHDPLTGAANRHSLLARLAEACAPAASVRAGLVLVSINQFEQISNLQGRYTGDALLCAVAERLSNLLQPGDLLARLDGPDFAILVPESLDGRLARAFADLLIAEMDAANFLAGEVNQRISLSIAVAASSLATSAEEWLGNAQLALAKARASTSVGAVRYRSAMREEVTARARLEADLRRALERGEFELYYQPQVDLATRRVVGAEALIRWNDPQRGLVTPSDFMNVVNTTSISEGVGDWVLDTAFRQAAAWRASGFDLRIGVNLCQAQMSSRGLAAKIARHLRATGAPPELLEFEVTEDIALDHDGRAKGTLAKLRELGASVALDDFGTGYGSLTYLKSFPVDRIKIDQSFVRRLKPGTEDAAIVQAVLDLSRAFRLSAIAEGVESEDAARMLTEMGCSEGQGYLFARPMAASALELLLQTEPVTI